MKILILHNRYQGLGGEDTVCASETSLLRNFGHEVTEYIEDNKDASAEPAIIAAANAVWSWRTQQTLSQILHRIQPDIVHVHNTFLRMSPAVYYTCKKHRVPVVQTLHNYRLLCPQAAFFRNGHICEDCMGKMIPWPGFIHGCWRGSRAQTVVPVTMLTTHRWLQTWQKQVDVFIALSEFARTKFIEGGLPAEKIVVKPNSLAVDPGKRAENGAYALFVGRLSPEKGINTLLEAWRYLDNIPLKIVGDGPLMPVVQELKHRYNLERVEILGGRSHEDVLSLMKDARYLLFQSECYEGFPMTIVEAFACGLPVIGPDLGSVAEIIADDVTGLHFVPGDPNDLAAKVRWAWEHPDEMKRMGLATRQEYESKYTAKQNYQMIMEIYERAIAANHKRR
jgi:glycosyltransferase involved in cell wall biosynthesis